MIAVGIDVDRVCAVALWKWPVCTTGDTARTACLRDTARSGQPDGSAAAGGSAH